MDNEVDGEALEKLGAIKMPEHMANEVFGNNVRYADNTTCIITENQDNPDFPFNVQFDSSKIPAKPQTQRKLTDSFLAGIGMPSGRTINLSAQPSGYRYTAPYSGYVYANGLATEDGAFLIIHGGGVGNQINAVKNQGMEVFLPVSKGTVFDVIYGFVQIRRIYFDMAIGEV